MFANSETWMVIKGEALRDVEAVDFYAASTASASASILQFKY